MSLTQQIVTDPKAGQAVSAITTATGLGTVFEWIPSDIGKLATVIGIVLSSLLIYVHVLNIKVAKKTERKVDLEIKLLKERSRGDHHE